MSFQGDTVIQDPEFILLCNTHSVQAMVIKPAIGKANKEMHSDGKFIKGMAPDKIALPSCLLLPLAWVPNFLQQQHTNKEAYIHMSKQLANGQQVRRRPMLSS